MRPEGAHATWRHVCNLKAGMHSLHRSTRWRCLDLLGHASAGDSPHRKEGSGGDKVCVVGRACQVAGVEGGCQANQVWQCHIVQDCKAAWGGAGIGCQDVVQQVVHKGSQLIPATAWHHNNIQLCLKCTLKASQMLIVADVMVAYTKPQPAWFALIHSAGQS